MFQSLTPPRLWLVAGLASALFLTRAGAATALPPAEDFFRPQTVSFAQLNPAGTHLAMRVYDAKTDSNGLRIVELASKKASLLPGTKVYDVHGFRWVGNERLVFQIVRDNLYATGLYLVHRDLTNPPSVLNENDAVQVLGSPAARPDNLFVWVYRDAHAQAEGRSGLLVELKLREGSDRGFDVDFSRVVDTVTPPACDGVLGWMRDRTGEVRYAFGQTKGEIALFRREPSRQWTRLGLDYDRYRPLAVDPDPHVLLVARLTAAGLRELVRLDTRDGSAGPVLFSDPKYDFCDATIRYRDNEKEVLGFSYLAQGPTQVWLNAPDVALQAVIDTTLPPNRTNLVISRSDDGTRLLVRSSSDQHPGTLYLFEPKLNTMVQIADYAPWLSGRQLGSVQVMSYKARDGLRLDGYVTLPANYVPGKPAPMIALPHGGPWVRDSWDYNAESQFFASRGYVVFRPNYRGSTGYNADISLKPQVDFHAMHEDVTDGVRALIKSGIADPKHVAIVGGSFGGYLAVCGAAYEPDLYKCAVTIAGVFDWSRIIQDGRRSNPLAYERLIRQLGDPKLQKEKFDALSPILSAAKIKIPVFIAHGEDDHVVAASQSHRLAAILRKAGVPYETMFETWEGHGFSTLKNRAELYERIDAFLKKNL